MFSDQDRTFIAQWARTVKNEVNEVGLIIAIMIGLYIAASEYPDAAWLHYALAGIVFAGPFAIAVRFWSGKQEFRQVEKLIQQRDQRD